MVLDCDTWPVPEDGCVAGCDIPEGTDPAVLVAASVQAGIILHTLSGRRVGTCTDTLRPLSECPECRVLPCCGAADRVRLDSPRGPVTSVDRVRVDGLEVTDWTFYPSSQLLYRVPPTLWPSHDNPALPCTSVDTMCVDVTIGTVPDAWALTVHAELTCELIKACTGGKCRIPSNATSVTSQGISITLSNEELLGFLPSVARWVGAVNPNKAQWPTRVHSPDLGGCRGCH